MYIFIVIIKYNFKAQVSSLCQVAEGFGSINMIKSVERMFKQKKCGFSGIRDVLKAKLGFTQIPVCVSNLKDHFVILTCYFYDIQVGRCRQKKCISKFSVDSKVVFVSYARFTVIYCCI